GREGSELSDGTDSQHARFRGRVGDRPGRVTSRCDAGDSAGAGVLDFLTQEPRRLGDANGDHGNVNLEIDAVVEGFNTVRRPAAGHGAAGMHLGFGREPDYAGPVVAAGDKYRLMCAGTEQVPPPALVVLSDYVASAGDPRGEIRVSIGNAGA